MDFLLFMAPWLFAVAIGFAWGFLSGAIYTLNKLGVPLTIHIVPSKKAKP